MKKKQKYPYNYVSVPLKNFNGAATFIGEPDPEMLEVVNKVAELAFDRCRK